MSILALPASTVVSMYTQYLDIQMARPAACKDHAAMSVADDHLGDHRDDRCRSCGVPGEMIPRDLFREGAGPGSSRVLY